MLFYVNVISLLLVNLLITSTTAQYQYLPQPTLPTTPCQKTLPNSQQPILNTFLSTYSSTLPIVDKIGTIASLLKQMPVANGQLDKRQYMAEALKQTALESLMFAANACSKADYGMPVPLCQTEVPNMAGVRYDVNNMANARYV